MMRVLVCGGRDYGDREALFAALDAIHAETPIGLVIQGSAPGADALAREWARLCKHTLLDFPADWKAYGKAAGPRRNALMIREGKPDLVLAAPGGRGTADCVRQARAAGVRVREVG